MYDWSEILCLIPFLITLLVWCLFEIRQTGKIRKEMEYNVVTNDKDIECDAMYHMDAYHFLMNQFMNKRKYDLIDLDPYGSCYDCLDLAFKLINTNYYRGGGICITFGEYGHKRWKRLDYLEPRYNIHAVEDIVPENFIGEVQRIAVCNKKQAVPWNIIQYSHILRVYFQVNNLEKQAPRINHTRWEERVSCGVTSDVKKELEHLAKQEDVSMETFLRDMIDDCIINYLR